MIALSVSQSVMFYLCKYPLTIENRQSSLLECKKPASQNVAYFRELENLKLFNLFLI